MTQARVALLLVLATLVYWPEQAAAQSGSPAAGGASAQGGAPQEAGDDPDLDLVPLQPDFTVITMQTTLRLPRHKSFFRVTHRFGRPLGTGDFGDLAEDFFGLDSGAQIGLEYRFGLMRGMQVGLHRTSDRTTQFFVHQDLLQEREGRLVSLTAIAGIDGTNNFRDSYSPSFGVVLSRAFAPVGTIFVQPMWVNNSNPLPSDLVDDNDSFLVGVGTRIRIRPTVYLVGEIIPRVAGNIPGVDQAAFALEKRAGGHVFQLNFSNALGTTLGQVSRGGATNDDWYLGFNISRKFY